MRVAASTADRVLAAVDAAADEIVDFTAALIRIPTVNPPGDAYPECARAIGDKLAAFGFEVDYVAADGRPEHTPDHPRLNVVGLRRGRHDRPAVHLNGHFDVVPAGGGWSVDPFAGDVLGGRIYGRGACDMKGGIAAALFAAEAIRRSGVELNGTIEISGTVDEESGGFAGAALLAEQGLLARDRIDYVIIPEPVLERVRTELMPALASRTTAVPVVPQGARHATLNINAIAGGQPVDVGQTPCVADSCRAVFDRRFLLEEGFEATKAEIEALLARAAAASPSLAYELRDLMVVHPVRTPEGSPLVASLDRHIEMVLGRPATHVASPGTYDHKHVDRIGGIRDCVAYGPGILDLAHQPDEWCGIDDLVAATKVLALSILDLTRTT
jgi:succinyl-diaminopimelate desuccinylase